MRGGKPSPRHQHQRYSCWKTHFTRCTSKYISYYCNGRKTTLNFISKLSTFRLNMHKKLFQAEYTEQLYIKKERIYRSQYWRKNITNPNFQASCAPGCAVCMIIDISCIGKFSLDLYCPCIRIVLIKWAGQS